MVDILLKGDQMNTLNKVRTVTYVALGFTDGLSDLTLAVRNPLGSITYPTVVIQGGGVYTASYTPDLIGTWQEKFTSLSNKDKVIRSVDIIGADDVDVKAAVTVVSGKVDDANTKLDAIQLSVAAIEAAETKYGGYFA